MMTTAIPTGWGRVAGNCAPGVLAGNEGPNALGKRGLALDLCAKVRHNSVRVAETDLLTKFKHYQQEQAMTREELLERKKAKRRKQNREAQRRRRDRLAQEEGRCLSGNLDSDRLARVSSDDTVVSTDRTWSVAAAPTNIQNRQGDGRVSGNGNCSAAESASVPSDRQGLSRTDDVSRNSVQQRRAAAASQLCAPDDLLGPFPGGLPAPRIRMDAIRALPPLPRQA